MTGLLLMSLGCAPRWATGAVELQDDFVDEVAQGYACSSNYFALDERESFRVQASILDGTVDFPTDLSSGNYLRIYTGLSLIFDESTDKCDDAIENGWQRLDYVYVPISGRGELVQDDSGLLSLLLQDVVMRADRNEMGEEDGAANWDNLADVAIENVSLPALPPDGNLVRVQ